MKINRQFAALAATVLLCASVNATAAPVSRDLTGTVIGGSGNWAGDVGTAFGTSLTFDLDEANAYAKELIAPSGEPAFTRWTYTSPADFSPYGASFTGAFGAFSTRTVWLEILDNFDTDAAGNPFGMTGVVDVLSVAGGDVVVDCSAGTVDPVTGCSDPDAPVLYGNEFQIHFVAGTDWFSGASSLPATMMPAAGLLGIFGDGEQITNGAVSATSDIEFYRAARVQVPEPAGLAFIGLGLGALRLARRRRRGTS